MTMRVSLQMNELACEHWQEPGIKATAKGFLVPNRPAQAGIMVKPLEQISAQENNGLNTKKPFAAGLLTGSIGTIKKYVVTNLSANKPGSSRVPGLVDQVAADLDAILTRGMRDAVRPLC
jgi:hypothetical protein